MCPPDTFSWQTQFPSTPACVVCMSTDKKSHVKHAMSIYEIITNLLKLVIPHTKELTGIGQINNNQLHSLNIYCYQTP